MIIEPRDHEPRNIYRLMTGVIVPRPIAFVSTVSADGLRNLAPFSFFTAISANPPVICFSPMIRGRDASTKDTLRNIQATREFVVSVVTEEIAEQMNATSADVPPDVDEFTLAHLTPVPSDVVRPPRVRESPVNMECRLVQIVEISPKPLGGSLVIGEVLRFHIADELVSNYFVDPDRLKAIGRMCGGTYVRTGQRFDMERPVWPSPR